MTFCALKALQGHFAFLARSSLFQLLAVKATWHTLIREWLWNLRWVVHFNFFSLLIFQAKNFSGWKISYLEMVLDSCWEENRQHWSGHLLCVRCWEVLHLMSLGTTVSLIFKTNFTRIFVGTALHWRKLKLAEVFSELAWCYCVQS